MQKTKILYVCDSCGNEFPSWSGLCSACGNWNTLKEIRVSGKNTAQKNDNIKTLRLSDVLITESIRRKTEISEFDRVLGGGIVGGSVILLGGEPGIGKSTLLLQVCDKIGDVVYLSAEESASQVKMRADRLKIKSEIEIVAGGIVDGLDKFVEKRKPSLLIIDSIQTIFLTSIESLPGSVSQVKECGIYLQQIAKKTNTPIIIVGHVTKDGVIAGPRLIEHLVDVVLYLEGDRFRDARILRGVKNRFGSTNEAGIFQMLGEGMVEVTNPSELFLNEKTEAPGSIITVMLEGKRPILVELQALVAPTHFGYPKRTCSGYDLNKLNLMAAVLSRKTSINLSNYDIYVNVIGGLKITEPAADLALCAAIISSLKNKPAPQNACIFGEVGLSGEIRKVIRQNEREKEAEKLGYKTLPFCKDINTFISKVFG